MKLFKYLGVVGSFMIITGGLWTCKDTITDGGYDDIVFPDSNVSYGRHVEPLFLRACAIPGCHDDNTQAGDLSLETYQAARARVGMIIPGDPDNSLLVRRIEGQLGGRMPPPPLPDLNVNQIKGIRTWIREGAQNN